MCNTYQKYLKVILLVVIWEFKSASGDEETQEEFPKCPLDKIGEAEENWMIWKTNLPSICHILNMWWKKSGSFSNPPARSFCSTRNLPAVTFLDGLKPAGMSKKCVCVYINIYGVKGIFFVHNCHSITWCSWLSCPDFDLCIYSFLFAGTQLQIVFGEMRDDTISHDHVPKKRNSHRSQPDKKLVQLNYPPVPCFKRMKWNETIK